MKHPKKPAPRARAPKPKDAWATCHIPTGNVNSITDATRESCMEACLALNHEEFKPIRVLILPADSAEARAVGDVRRLTAALRKIRGIVGGAKNPEPNVCQDCGDDFNTRDGREDEGVCDRCAQEERDAVREIADAALRPRRGAK